MDKRTLQMSSVERNDWQTHLCDGAMAQRLATDKLCRVSQNLRDNTKLQVRQVTVVMLTEEERVGGRGIF